MKKRSSISLGPGAASLILIFVALSMAVLAMLALMTARNDQKLSDRSAVAEALPEDVTLEDRVRTWRETDGARTLSCGLRIEPQGSPQRTVWVKYTLTSAIEELDTGESEMVDE